MIYLVSLFQVRAADACAFENAFCQGGTWQELHCSLPGYIHSDLLVSSASPTCFLLLQFFQSEDAAQLAQRNSEVLSFRSSLRMLAINHVELGVFRFRKADALTWPFHSDRTRPFVV
jgi:hypothetical protein